VDLLVQALQAPQALLAALALAWPVLWRLQRWQVRLLQLWLKLHLMGTKTVELLLQIPIPIPIPSPVKKS